MKFIILLFMLPLLGKLGSGQSENPNSQCTRSFLDIGNVLPPETSMLRFFDAAISNSSVIQRQVIVPQMQFSCHGVITSWSALTIFQASQSAIEHLDPRITLTVWRPNANSLYDLVGYNTLTFFGQKLRNGIISIDNSTLSADTAYFQFTEEIPEPNSHIFFQPGDVIGWSVFNIRSTIHPPLSIVYRSVNDGEEEVNLLSTLSSSLNPCSVCTHDVYSEASSVIPYLSVQYNITDPSDIMSSNSSAVQMCSQPSPEEVVNCSTTTTPAAPTPIATSPAASTIIHTRSCSGLQCQSNIFPIAAAVVAVIVVLLLLIIAVIIILCRGKKKRKYFLSKLFGKGQEFQENPTYTSADNVIRNNHKQSQDPLHYKAEDGVVYSQLNTKRHDSNAKGLFDGECYTSAYQANGQCHIYQELMEAAVSNSGTSSVSHEVINSKPPIPVRSTSSSLMRLPHSIQASADNIETRVQSSAFPHGHSRFSHADSKPSMPHLQTKPSLPILPYLETKPSLASFPYLEIRPSQSNLVESLEVTPPNSASANGEESSGPTMRKLFHAVDDDILRVPNASERQEFKSMENTDDIYSKLKHPRLTMKRGSVDTVFLDQSDQYWAPSSSATELYDQLAKRKFREIQRKQISTTECIGGGNFGTVHKGLWMVPGGMIEVAVKTLNKDSSDHNEIKFLREAAIMGQFLHPNVVKLFGVVTLGEPLMIVLELMHRGDLKNYLRSFQYSTVDIPEDMPSILLNFCRQIGYGMNYLANKGFVHRDLAARNILLAEDLTCKIGDFGMARDLEEGTVYFSQGGTMPLKWTAPEALKYGQFSSASDVWSYGMLLFEIWSLGQKPLQGIAANRLMTLMRSGYCQPPPPGCPRAIYQLMVQCWHTLPDKRITFSKICTYLSSSSSKSLLAWNTIDRTVSTRAMELGAPLSKARMLYHDLQYIYQTKSLV